MRRSTQRRFVHLGLLAATIGIAAPVAFAKPSGGGIRCTGANTPPLSFGERVYVDRERAGGEPVSIVAQDGSITVSTHAGTTHAYKDPQSIARGSGDFLNGYTNQTLNWRSIDGGQSWRFVGSAGTQSGPHSPTSSGFSDPDLTMDAAGNLYNTEINLANVAVFASPDDGKSWPIANPVASSGDRPWVTGAGEDQVYLYVNAPKQLLRSDNRGVTWNLVSTSFPADGKLIVDPLNPSKGLIGPISSGGAAISGDGGVTWEAYESTFASSTQFFGVIAVDKAGNIYAASAGGYLGAGDDEADGAVEFNYFNRKTKEWLPEPVSIPIPKGDAMWPWLIAGDDGRVAVVWYQNMAGAPEKFYAMAAYTMNGSGSVETCRDAAGTVLSSKKVPPRFAVANASKKPIHDGPICLSGTGCNGATDFRKGDRRLGDFFTVNFDHTGRLFIVSADTTLRGPGGVPKLVSNPVFIKQKTGGRMLEKPMELRPSRCLFPLETC